MFCFTCVMCKLHSLFFNINNSYCRLDSCILCILCILVFVCRYSEIPNSCVRGNFSVLKFQVVYLKIISEHNNLSFQYFLRGFCNFHRWTYLSTWQYYILHSPSLKVSSSKHVALVSVLNDWSCFMICWLEFQKKYTKYSTLLPVLLYFPCPWDRHVQRDIYICINMRCTFIGMSMYLHNNYMEISEIFMYTKKVNVFIPNFLKLSHIQIW